MMLWMIYEGFSDIRIAKALDLDKTTVWEWRKKLREICK